ncbi:uncharacterized protein Gasu_26980 [Galdieria sulphuraria]|uniref:Uncharacterized protein n=1 Tax=Galdieria sulphuraria TaxID=130081 RepID=M2XIJ8_GALSU|nr:uncharacterized protein Gasu_26980 [Galdieria sulphuraria]EME29912.1 hypothetical protein Gasu_26980 [Galdieria sulphuraria]|eukprot:XP_005706432.1 hypothetical protein Gasu_26980 [Galdieria sulphuraria]
MAGCEYFDALSYEAELGFQRWEEELEQVIGIIRHCIDTADTFHTIKFVKSSKLLAIFSLFTELEDKLWFTQTLQLEKQWRLLREKTDNLKEQAEKLQATVRKNFEAFQQDKTQDKYSVLLTGTCNQVTPLEYLTYLDYISRLVRLQTSEMEQICQNSQFLADVDTFVSKDRRDLEKFAEQSFFQRSEVKDWFLKLGRLRET